MRYWRWCIYRNRLLIKFFRYDDELTHFENINNIAAYRIFDISFLSDTLHLNISLYNNNKLTLPLYCIANNNNQNIFYI